MKNCVIFCAGGCNGLAAPLGPEDYLIAADGGLTHTRKLGLVPQEILGDFDSLGYTPEGSTVFPVEKDDTDAMLAIRRGLELGFKTFYLYGSLDGPRLDHTLANCQSLLFLAEQGAVGYLIGNQYIVTVVKDGSLSFPAQCSGILSLFCLGPDAHGVDIEGLQYPLENHTLTAAFPLGVSNHFVGTPSRIRVSQGSLLVIWDRANGFPGR